MKRLLLLTALALTGYVLFCAGCLTATGMLADRPYRHGQNR